MSTTGGFHPSPGGEINGLETYVGFQFTKFGAKALEKGRGKGTDLPARTAWGARSWRHRGEMALSVLGSGGRGREGHCPHEMERGRASGAPSGSWAGRKGGRVVGPGWGGRRLAADK